MRSQELSDGSVDYGQGVIGPSGADRLLFNHPLEPSAPIPTFPTRAFLQTGAGIGMATILTACSGSVGEQNENKPTNQPAGMIDAGAGGEVLGVNTGPVLKLQFPFDGTWYLTSGPHTYTEPSGTISSTIKSELDFAPPEVVPCKGNAGKSLDNEWVTASESGKVISIVDPERITIRDSDGFDIAYEHVKPKAGLAIGDLVRTGDKFSNPGCFGNTTGIHVDISVSKDGVAIPATKLIYSGYSVEEDPTNGNYNGSLMKGDVVKTADGGRCATDQACIGGIRNDVSNDSNEVTGAVKTEAPVPEFVPANDGEAGVYKYAEMLFKQFRMPQEVGGVRLEQRFNLSANEMERMIQALARGEIVGTEEKPIVYYLTESGKYDPSPGSTYTGYKTGTEARLTNLRFELGKNEPSPAFSQTWASQLSIPVDISIIQGGSSTEERGTKLDQWLGQDYDFNSLDRNYAKMEKNTEQWTIDYPGLRFGYYTNKQWGENVASVVYLRMFQNGEMKIVHTYSGGSGEADPYVNDHNDSNDGSVADPVQWSTYGFNYLFNFFFRESGNPYGPSITLGDYRPTVVPVILP